MNKPCMFLHSSTAVLREKLQFAESGSHLSLFSFRSGPDVPLVIDRVSGQVLHSVVSVRLLNRLLTLIYMCTVHDNSSPEINSQGYRSRSRIRANKDGNIVGLITILDRG